MMGHGVPQSAMRGGMTRYLQASVRVNSHGSDNHLASRNQLLITASTLRPWSEPEPITSAKPSFSWEAWTPHPGAPGA